MAQLGPRRSSSRLPSGWAAAQAPRAGEGDRAEDRRQPDRPRRRPQAASLSALRGEGTPRSVGVVVGADSARIRRARAEPPAPQNRSIAGKSPEKCDPVLAIGSLSN